jgi:hypothetical protein
MSPTFKNSAEPENLASPDVHLPPALAERLEAEKARFR